MTERGRPERRPLRKVVSANFIGATARLQLTLECGHEVTRQGYRYGDPSSSYTQCRCDECPRREP